MKIAAAPQWLIDLCEAPRQQTHEVLGELDQPVNIQRAIAFLKDARPAIQGDGGDDHTYKTAAAVIDFGISEPQALDLMLEHWNERCQPPWQPGELQRKIENANSYRTKPIGASDARAEFEAVPVPANENRKPRAALFYEWGDQAEPDLSRAPLIEHWLDQGAMSVIYGESNVGKTFVTMDMAWAVALGQPWHGCETEKGLVVYVAAEAGSSARRRIKALRLSKGAATAFALVPCPVDLLHPDGDVGPLVALIRTAERERGQKAVLVVVDTLSRALAGGNENDSADMGALVKNLDQIRVGLGCHLAVVHHSGKDKAKGARGHSLLRAATDTEIEVGDNRVVGTKQRDQEIGRPVGFRLVSVEIGHDRRGKPVTSAVVETFTPIEVEEQPDVVDVVMRVLGGAPAMPLREVMAGVAMDPRWADKSAEAVRKAITRGSGWEYEVRPTNPDKPTLGAIVARTSDKVGQMDDVQVSTA